MKWARVAALAVTAALAIGPASAAGDGGASAPPPEPADYKMDEYRSPTPATLKGARVVSTGEVEALWRDKGAVLLDTMPRDRHPPNLPPGTVWRDRARDHIPGSAWLPNVGYGALAPDMDAYFKSSLAALSETAPGRPLLFYCKMDCWMSWNAAKRAMALGYRDVLWYPEGTDGWEKAGLPLEAAKPYATRPPSQ